MSKSTLTFPFVDLHSRLRPERLERLARNNRRTEPGTAPRPIIEEIADWLFRAQDAIGDGHLPGFYQLQTGWLSVDAETSAAAMATMLSLADALPGHNVIGRAMRLGNALAARRDGSDRSSRITVRSADVAAEAWAILGWIALYEHSAKPECKDAAVVAGDHLIEYQQNSGAITLPHKATAAWALQRLFLLTPKESFRVIADSLGNAVASNSAPDGYLQGCVDAYGADPALIHVAQALHGLLEAGLLSGRRSWILAARRGAQRLRELYREKGTLAGRYGPTWRADHSFNCMAGCAQTALSWLRLYQYGFSDEYYDDAVQIARFITSTIDTRSSDPGIRGGIRAGYPLWIDYHPLAYSAMAAKLALDVFLLEKELSPGRKPFRRLRLKRSAEGGHLEGGTT